MQSEVHTIDPVTVELSVEVPWDRVRKGLEASFGKLQKSAKIKGFRPGKVPRNVLSQLYGRQVRAEVAATLLEEGLIEAVQKHKLAIVSQPRLDSIPQIQEGEPLSFKAKLEIRPSVERVETSGLEVSRPRSAVGDAEVDAEIQRLRERHAEIVTPDPMRPSKAGDLLTLDYTVEIDGEEKKDMAATERVVELAGGRLLPEFETALVGKQPGDDADIRVAYGDDVQSDDLRGKRALFRVKIREVREKVLPELDDELAKDLGDHQTLAELKTKTREQLEKGAKARADSAVREQLVEKLVEKNPVPVPPSLVSQAEQAMRQELAMFMQMTGQPPQPLDEETEKTLRERAEKKVRAAILMGELARQQAIRVEPEEIDARMAKMAEQTGKHIAKIRVEMAGEKREELENKILEDKLLEYLLAQATVTDAPSEESKPADEASASP
jgi:trigger factor